MRLPASVRASNSSATPTSSCRFSTRLSDSIVPSASNVAISPESSIAVRTTSASGAPSAASRSPDQLEHAARVQRRRRARWPRQPGISSARANASASGILCSIANCSILRDRPLADAPFRRARRAQTPRRGRPGCARHAGTRSRRVPPCARRTSGRRRRGTGCRSGGTSLRARATARSSGRRPRYRSRLKLSAGSRTSSLISPATKCASSCSSSAWYRMTFVPSPPVGEQALVLALRVVADERVRRVEDRLRRPVVLLELEDLARRDSRARTRGCCGSSRRGTRTPTGPRRRRRTGCGTCAASSDTNRYCAWLVSWYSSMTM